MQGTASIGSSVGSRSRNMPSTVLERLAHQLPGGTRMVALQHSKRLRSAPDVDLADRQRGVALEHAAMSQQPHAV
jgi:hypothetical protein